MNMSFFSPARILCFIFDNGYVALLIIHARVTERETKEQTEVNRVTGGGLTE